MNALVPLQQWFQRHAAWAGGLAAPLLVITVLSMMVLPLAPWVLGTFFAIELIFQGWAAIALARAIRSTFDGVKPR